MGARVRLVVQKGHPYPHRAILRERVVIVANMFARGQARRQDSDVAGRAGRRPPVAVALSRWTCCIVGLAVFVAAQRSWAEAVLTDRGAELLVVTRNGWELAPTGQLAVGIGVAVTLLCVATSWWPWTRRLVPLVPVAGLSLAILATSRLGAADPVADKISKLRIGTFQTERPTVVTAVGSGLWWCLAAGCFLVAVGLYWVVLERRVAAGLTDRPESSLTAVVEGPGPGAAS